MKPSKSPKAVRPSKPIQAWFNPHSQCVIWLPLPFATPCLILHTDEASKAAYVERITKAITKWYLSTESNFG